MKVELYNSNGELLKTTHTNEDGQLSSSLLTENEMKKVIWGTPSFLNKVSIRFYINDSIQHYRNLFSFGIPSLWWKLKKVRDFTPDFFNGDYIFEDVYKTCCAGH